MRSDLRRGKDTAETCLKGLVAIAWLCFIPASATAESITLQALQRDGYGVVQLTRPRPNVLTVIATIDGRKERLVVDTGWAGEGISLQRNEAGALATAAQPMENFRTSARGGRIA